MAASEEGPIQVLQTEPTSFLELYESLTDEEKAELERLLERFGQGNRSFNNAAPTHLDFQALLNSPLANKFKEVLGRYIASVQLDAFLEEQAKIDQQIQEQQKQESSKSSSAKDSSVRKAAPRRLVRPKLERIFAPLIAKAGEVSAEGLSDGVKNLIARMANADDIHQDYRIDLVQLMHNLTPEQIQQAAREMSVEKPAQAKAYQEVADQLCTICSDPELKQQLHEQLQEHVANAPSMMLTEHIHDQSLAQAEQQSMVPPAPGLPLMKKPPELVQQRIHFLDQLHTLFAVRELAEKNDKLSLTSVKQQTDAANMLFRCDPTKQQKLRKEHDKDMEEALREVQETSKEVADKFDKLSPKDKRHILGDDYADELDNREDVKHVERPTPEGKRELEKEEGKDVEEWVKTDPSLRPELKQLNEESRASGEHVIDSAGNSGNRVSGKNVEEKVDDQKQRWVEAFQPPQPGDQTKQVEEEQEESSIFNTPRPTPPIEGGGGGGSSGGG